MPTRTPAERCLAREGKGRLPGSLGFSAPKPPRTAEEMHAPNRAPSAARSPSDICGPRDLSLGLAPQTRDRPLRLPAAAPSLPGNKREQPAAQSPVGSCLWGGGELKASRLASRPGTPTSARGTKGLLPRLRGRETAGAKESLTGYTEGRRSRRRRRGPSAAREPETGRSCSGLATGAG